MESLNDALERSVRALLSYQDEITQLGEDSPVQVSPEESITELISILVNVKVKINNELKEKHVIKVSDKTMESIEKAIDLMLHDPSTEDKVNAMQLLSFGTNVPFWNVLRDVQNLLRVIKQLNDSRGKKVERTQHASGA